MKLDIEQLKGSREFLRAVFDNITSAIFLVDSETRIRAINDSFEALFYKSEDKLIGELCGNALGCVYVQDGSDCGTTKDCGSCGLRRALTDALHKNIQSNKKKLIREFVIRGVKVKKIFQYSTRLIQFNGDRMILVIMDDITDLELQRIKIQEQNERLEVLNAEKNRLMGMAAHDLRNPLGVIQGFASLIKEGENISQQDKVEMINEIEKVSAYSLELINDLLDFSSVESGDIKLNLDKQVDVIQLIEDNVSLNRILADSAGIELHTRLPGFPVMLDVDISKVQQILNNLIGNAFKYSDRGTKVLVTASLEDSYLRICVRDEGPGISRADRERIFYPFEITRNRAQHGQKSTGLGLAIVKRIVEAHNGIIDVDSEEGQGSVFWFTLPLDRKPVDF